MSIKANIKVGSATIQVESDTQVGLIEAAGFWGECPTKCGNCTSPNIGFFSRTPSGNLYVGVKCHECEHSLNFGQNKDGGKLFIKQGEAWQPPYQGGNRDDSPRQNQEHQSHHQQAPPSSGHGGAQDDDDIPY